MKKWTSNDIPDQSGKIVIVTGANSGLGFETALALAGKGALVIMACRNTEKGNAAIEQIKIQHPGSKIEVSELDLSDLSSVRAFAENFIKKYDRLDLLINNAGLMVPPFGKTKDGFENQFGTNHLGHFALTGLLFGHLLSSENSRIITLSSTAHKQGKVDFDNLNAEKKYSRIGAYGLSKLSNLLFTYELQRRLEAAGIKMIVAAAHPGWTATNLQQYSGIFKHLNPIFGQTPAMGALPTLYAATASDVKSGDYYGPGGFMEMKGYPKKVKSNSRSHDKEVAGKLWDISENLTGITYKF